MRNLKKILALVLALVMTMSVMATAAFTDAAEIDGAYDEAAEVLAGLKVFVGRTDGSFDPKASITRAEVAAIIYRMVTGDVNNLSVNLYTEGADFTDTKGHWAEGYIGYCNNAGFVTGYGNGKFGPNDNVTGMQAAAMILRAIGYDAQDEFTGANWDKYVAKYAQELGMFKNLKGDVNLNKAVSREVVAEILFQAIQKPMVEWTPAFEYQPTTILGKTTSLGLKTFNLEKKDDLSDKWGRPYHNWINNVTGTIYATIEDVAVYKATVAVDECDVAKALSLTKAAAIEKAFIDGVEYNAADAAVTTNKYPSIDPYAYTSKMGAQGRQLEIYKMGTAYRVVEINTYLGQVTGVSAAKVDKNGHVTDATITVGVWGVDGDNTADWTLTKKATGYAVNDYVLVTVSNPAGYSATAAQNKAVLETVAAVAPVAGGTQTGWTGTTTGYGTTTIATTTYADSDKFILNNVKGTNAGNWDVITDTYGNLIGLVAATKNYLTIEAARWIDVDHTLYGGYVLANVYLADGTRVEGVKISKVISENADLSTAVNNDDVTPAIAEASFSDITAMNDIYADHLFAYSIAADGSYVIDYTNRGTDLTEKKATIANKGTYIYDTTAGTYVPVNDNTVFLVADYTATGALTTTYTKYVGKDNVPSMTDATVCYLMKGAYASVVLVTEYALKANTYVALVQDVTSTTAVGTKYAFNVYKYGETTPTTVYYTSNKLPVAYGTGFYTLTVNSSNVVTKADVVIDYVADIADVSGNLKDATYTWYRDAVANNNGFTMLTKNGAQLWVNDAKYIVVTSTNGVLSFAEGTLADAGADAKVMISFKGTGANKNANYIYVLKIDNQATNTLTTVDSINVVGAPPKAGVQLGALTSPQSAKVTFTAKWFDRTTGTFVEPTTIALVNHEYTVVVTDVAAKAGYVLGASFDVSGFTTTVAGTWTYNF